MTREEIEGLSGRELDAWIGRTLGELTPGVRVCGCRYRPPNTLSYCTSCGGQFAPEYSSTWEGMGRVVEAMEARGRYWEARNGRNGLSPGGYICVFRRMGDWANLSGMGSGETPMLAVCRAALLALAGETVSERRLALGEGGGGEG